MVDVLVPLLATLKEGGDGLLDRLRESASTAAAQTVPMRAVRGRASFLGERSIGHLDPGARSASLMIATICDVLGAARWHMLGLSSSRIRRRSPRGGPKWWGRWSAMERR